MSQSHEVVMANVYININYTYRICTYVHIVNHPSKSKQEIAAECVL